MTDDDPREPEYDPESVGLPDMVDPDSTAFDEQESVREGEGDPVLWPDDRPVALDAATSLDEQLAREVPDVDAETPDELAADADDEPYGATVPVDDFPDDASVSDTDDDSDDDPDDDFDDSDEDADDLGDSDDGPDPYADEEAEDAGTFTGGLQDDETHNQFDEEEPVGRLADPDDDGSGGRNDRTVAEDFGMAGGGASAEESAMHVIDDEDGDDDGSEG
jgi:hypothetical protein